MSDGTADLDINDTFANLQIGKGYFVERTVLQERWKALGLPEVSEFF